MSHGRPARSTRSAASWARLRTKPKDKRGRQLIQLFCKPQPRTKSATPATSTHPERVVRSSRYSRRDIVAMRAISKKLPKGTTPSARPSTSSGSSDQRINDRGFAVDLDLA